MNEMHSSGGSPRGSGTGGRGSFATSLFGGAILATVTTASLATMATDLIAQTVFNSVTEFAGTTVTSHYVVVTGYDSPTINTGGGIFVAGTAGGTCTPDNGLVFVDMSGACFYRTKPTNSVLEWGAQCNVEAVQPSGKLFPYVTANAMGTLFVPSALISGQPAPQVGENIVISQIGVPTLWGSSTPAVSMTRFSKLGGAQVDYSPGDVISFVGTGSNTGTFSQQAAIIVDAVSSTGSITRSHALWGGLYQAGTTVPTGAMVQDATHSYCGNIGCGGATITPAWSGWSALNSQPFANQGTGYAVGDIVTLSIGDTLVNQGHYATIVVEGTTSTVGISGQVSAYDWLDYGSFMLTTMSSTGTLTQLSTSGAGTNFAFGTVVWTQAPFATTIMNVGTTTIGGTGFITIGLGDQPAFPGTIDDIELFYYGWDDSAALARAINAAPKGGLVIPAGCGTTQTLDLTPQGATTNVNQAQNVNTFLRGGNLQSSGLYAFAPTPSKRSATNPVLAHIIYVGALSGAGFLTVPGGGLSNMIVEGLGVPEGYGYLGMLEGTAAPTGYVGPPATPSATPPTLANLPTAGNLVEIDAASQMHIDKVLVTDGAIGLGNSVLQCGMDESDPAHYLQTNSIANITVTDSRFDDNYTFSGPTDPDFVLRLESSCQGSVYDAVTAYDGTKADILVYGGNLFSRTHLNSDAANTSAGLIPAIPWTPATFGLAGMADYGFYVIGNTSISETQCDVANIACVLTIPSALAPSNPGQITDTQVKCGGFSNTPPGYFGIELGLGTVNTTVTGTSAAPKCTIYSFQLVKLDGLADSTTSLCGNSDAAVAGCTGYQGSFAQGQPGQSYTQPAVAYSTGTIGGGTLYAMPIFSPVTGGTITKLGLDVIGAGSATTCSVGVYNASVQAPTSLINIGTVTSGGATVVASGTVSITGAGMSIGTLASPGAELAPGTLYFLAVGCNGSVTVEGVTGTGAGSMTGPLVGARHLIDNNGGIADNSWSFSTVLPINFPVPSRTSGQWIPNVYAEP
jgi:hypothetical protein